MTETNYRALMNECTCLADLVDIPKARLEEIMGGPRNAKMLRDFLDAKCPTLIDL